MATVADIGEIIGYTRTVAIAGQPMTVTLNWHALRPADRDYTVFVHLLDAKGQLQAQHDGQPDTGNFVTSRWSNGISFQDAHVLSLPANLTPGQYTLAAGVYDPATGGRLVMRDSNNVELPDRVLILEQIEVR